jgi:hypothetical protein
MRKNFSFLLCFSLTAISLVFGSSLSFAKAKNGPAVTEKQPAWQDRAIGAAFKTLSKALISATDLEKLKQENIKKIKGMDEEKFRSRYSDYFNIINQAPLLQSKYRLSKDMTRQQAIERLKGLDKKELCDMVDSVPDSVIAQEFNKNVEKYKSKVENQDFSQKIDYIWGRVREKITGSKIP